MSNNAVDAYESGEMPISKWTKSAIMDEVEEIIDDRKVIMALQTIPLRVLKDKLLTNSSWHHTSNHYNKTNFYSIDVDKLEELTVEEIKSWDTSKPKTESNTYRGTIDYLTWGGTRKHPVPEEHRLENVNIEERGCFYYVTDDNGKQLLKKKIGSNGTYVTKYDKEE